MKIFISYSNEDRAFTRMMAEDLRRNGHEIFYDEWTLSIGTSINTEISNAMSLSDYVVVILSQYSTHSSWIETEWQAKYWDRINQRKIKVIPVLVDDCEIPEVLRENKYVDFRTDYLTSINKLLQFLDS